MTIYFTGYAQVSKTIIAEHYTNTKCGICGLKNPTFYNTLENYPEVLHVAYHPSSPYASCIFSMHNPVENDARTNYYGIYGGTPRVVLSGSVIPPASQLLTPDQIEAKLGKMSDYSMEITLQGGVGDTIVVQLVTKRVSGSGQDELNLFAVLAEMEISYNAPNGENTHHDVFRKDLINESVSLNEINDSVVIIKNYVPHAEWQSDEMFVVGMLQKVSTKEILQSAKSDVAGNIMFTGYNRIEEISAVFYPNPVKNQINFIESAKNEFIKAELFNIYGQKIVESELDQPIDMKGLPAGQYILIFSDINNKIYSSKVQKY